MNKPVDQLKEVMIFRLVLTCADRVYCNFR